MIIETERLILREMTREDFDALSKVLKDDDNMRYYPHSFTDEHVKNWIERNIKRYSVLGFGLWAMCLKETGEVIGDAGVTMQSINSFIAPEIGYHVRSDLHRRGYAREATEAVRDWTFNNLPFGAIYSYMKYTNLPSQKTAMSWGCKLVDEYADEVNEITRVYAITRQEWQALTQNNV